MKKLIAAVLLILFTACNLYSKDTPDVFTLDNGLKVLIKPVKTSPIVSFNIWINAGSANEQTGEEGFMQLISDVIANYHLQSSRDKTISHTASVFKHFTSNDYTCHFVMGSSEHLEIMIEQLTSSVFNNPMDDTTLLNQARQSLMNIERMNENAFEKSRQLLLQNAFKVHTYRNPVSGYYDNFENLDKKSVRNLYENYYTPSNTWVIITGNVEKTEAIDAIRKNMGQLPAKQFEHFISPDEPKQISKRKKVYYGDIDLAHIMMGWRVGDISETDQYALDVLAQLVGGDKSSLLWQKLVDDMKIASIAGTAYHSTRHPSLFKIAGITTPGNARRFVKKARQTVYQIVKEDVCSLILEKAKQQLITRNIFSKQCIEQTAMLYGHYAMLSDVEKAERVVSNIRNVTTQCIKRVAKKYFKDQNLTVVRYEPEPPPPDSPPELLTLDNGIRLILKQNHSQPVVTASIKVRAGSLYQSLSQAGIAEITAQLIDKQIRQTEPVKETLEMMGTVINTRTHSKYTSFDLTSLSENFLPSFEILVNALADIQITQNRLNKTKDFLKNKVALQSRSINDYSLKNSLQAMSKNMANVIYPDIDSVKQIQISQVRDFFNRHYSGSNTVVSITGDFYPAEIKADLLAILGTINKGTKVAPADIKFSNEQQPLKTSFKLNVNRSRLVYLTPLKIDSESSKATAEILSVILHSKISNILFEDLKNKNVPIYETNSGIINDNIYMAAFTSDTNSAVKLKTLFSKQLEKLRNYQLDKSQIQRAILFSRGKHAIDTSKNLSLADITSSDVLQNYRHDFYLTYPDKLSSVTTDDVKKMLQKQLTATDSYILSVTSP